MAEEAKKNWMTQASFDRLQAELDERTGPIRSEITKKIDAARREGDLKENGGYHAARDEQSQNETRILELQSSSTPKLAKPPPMAQLDRAA